MPCISVETISTCEVLHGGSHLKPKYVDFRILQVAKKIHEYEYKTTDYVINLGPVIFIYMQVLVCQRCVQHNIWNR
jgi:hypothetical protein